LKRCSNKGSNTSST